MKLEYSVAQNDFLQHQLFIASKSERIKSKRRNSWLLITCASLSLAFVFYQGDNKFMMYYCLGFAVLTLLFYPLYLRFHYKKHYRKFIEDTYKNRDGEIATVIFNDNNIETFDKTGESKINHSEIEEITETGEYFYLKMRSGGSLIVPKRKIEAIDDLRTLLQRLGNRLNIKFVSDLNWKWR
ncbi:MAG TPA: YcxB family protein [Ferruginibacter sp.]|nr:YcxB family protein [Ferruginibacter sp.]